jgi:hypothetical protein
VVGLAGATDDGGRHPEEEVIALMDKLRPGGPEAVR